jgi:hypothetical protein
MCMVAFSVVMTVVVLNLHHRTLGAKEMNHWVSYTLIKINLNYNSLLNLGFNFLFNDKFVSLLFT